MIQELLWLASAFGVRYLILPYSFIYLHLLYLFSYILFLFVFVCVVCKSSIELHNGHISVFSEGIGLGSTFSIALPTVVNDSTNNTNRRNSIELTERRIITLPYVISPQNEVKVHNTNNNNSSDDI